MMRWMVAVVVVVAGLARNGCAAEEYVVDESLIRALAVEGNAAVILEKIGAVVESYRHQGWLSLRDIGSDTDRYSDELEALEQRTFDVCEAYFPGVLRACDPLQTGWDSSVIPRGDAGMTGVSLGSTRLLVRALGDKAVEASESGDGAQAMEYLLASLGLSDRLASNENGFFPYILATALYAVSLDGIDRVLEHGVWDEAQRARVAGRVREIRDGWHAQSVRMIRESNASIVSEVTETVATYDAEWREERPEDDDSDIPPLERFDAEDFSRRVDSVAAVWGTAKAEVIIESLSEVELYGEMIGVYKRAHRNYMLIMGEFDESIDRLTRASGP